jgi:hypothetical protein
MLFVLFMTKLLLVDRADIGGIGILLYPAEQLAPSAEKEPEKYHAECAKRFADDY